MMMQHIILENEWKKFNRYYRFHFLMMLGFFMVSAVLSYFIIGMLEHSNSIYSQFLTTMEEVFDSKGIVSESSNFEIMVALFLNNAKACAIGLLLGFIPIVIFPYISSIANGAIVGLVVKLVAVSGGSLFNVIVLGLMPHGITELTAMFLSMGMGSFASITILKKIFQKEKESTPSFKEMCKMIGMTYVSVVIPLLVISAVIEAYVTPLLLNTTM